VKLVLDTGALIALERRDRAMWRRYAQAQRSSIELSTHGGVVGQAWRGHGSRRALLSMALEGVTVRPLDLALGRAAGELLGAARKKDVIDAAVVLLADDEDRILTCDPGDLEPLAAALGRDIEIVVV
jgi:hypothetical protein